MQALETFLRELSPTQAKTLLVKLDAEQCRRSFRHFVKVFWPLVEPAVKLIPNWHVDAICEHLQAVATGGIQKLIINVPPGHAKSNLVSVAFPAWVWSFNPRWRSLFASYALGLAVRDSVRTRTVINSELYRDMFMRGVDGSRVWALSDDSDCKDYFSNTESGFRFSLSVGSKVTGYRGNAVVVDDPLNARDALSKPAKAEVVYWWDQVMSSRVNDKRRDAYIIIMQRLAEDDLSGYLAKQDLGYEYLVLPTEFEAKRRTTTHVATIHPFTKQKKKALFWSDPRKEEGELLFPQLFPGDVVATIKRELGASGFAGQHQQRPAPQEGNLFKKAHWRFYATANGAQRPDGCSQAPAVVLPSSFDSVLLSLDATFKDGPKNDFVCFLVIGVSKANRYVLDCVRARLSFTATLVRFAELAARFPEARRKLVEDKANGSAIIDTLKNEIPGIIPINPQGGKEARANAIAPQVESGNVYLPEGAFWCDAFVQEFADFPNGAHDDQVDALSQALLYLMASTAMSKALNMVKL